MIDLPPLLILPDHYVAARPAVISAAVNPARYFPVAMTRLERRAVVAELRNVGRLNRSMLPGMVPIVGGRRAPPVLSFNAGYSSNADSTSYSFSTSGIAAGDKLVIATAHWNSTATLRSVTTRTIGGVAATSAIGGSTAVSGTSGSSIGVDIFYLRTSAANPTIAWSLDASGSVRAYMGVWIIEGSLLSDTPYSNDKTTVTNGTSISRNVNLAAGGVGVMALTVDNAVASVTLSGVDVTDWNLNHAEGGTRMAGGHYASVAGQVGRSISATYASGGGEALGVVSWR